MREHGTDFIAISETIGTKTPDQLQTFYGHYHRRYRLDKILADYESKQNSVIELSDDEIEEVSK